MDDSSASGSGPSITFVASNGGSSIKKSAGRLIASGNRSFSHQCVRELPSQKGWINHGKLRKVATTPVASFLIEVAALEIVRRFSKAKCPLVWSVLQGLQVFCYPPFKWLQRWNPFRTLIQGMQMLSRPLLVITIADAISDRSECKERLSDTEDPRHTSESAVISAPDISSVPSTKTWLLDLYKELHHQGFTLPERIDEDELERFYATANGDLSCCLSLVKKTITWRENYRLLSEQELEVWSNMVFWHGFDAKGRLCLVVRLGLACMSVSLSDRPRFAQAIVSQVEYGVLHLMDHEHSRITVLVDCEGLPPLKFPMKISLTCSNILQEHFPKRLGCVYVIRLPPIARVIAQTFIQFLKPGTRVKLKILGDRYKETLSELIKELPSCLGGLCTCMRCTRDDKCISQDFCVSEMNSTDSIADTTSQDVWPALDTFDDTDMDISGTFNDTNMDTSDSSEQVLRKAVLGVLIFWVLIVLLAGVYDPESRPF